MEGDEFMDDAFQQMKEELLRVSRTTEEALKPFKQAVAALHPSLQIQNQLAKMNAVMDAVKPLQMPIQKPSICRLSV
jgi:hypothetical protein